MPNFYLTNLHVLGNALNKTVFLIADLKIMIISIFLYESTVIYFTEPGFKP